MESILAEAHDHLILIFLIRVIHGLRSGVFGASRGLLQQAKTTWYRLEEKVDDPKKKVLRSGAELHSITTRYDGGFSPPKAASSAGLSRCRFRAGSCCRREVQETPRGENRKPVIHQLAMPRERERERAGTSGWREEGLTNTVRSLTSEAEAVGVGPTSSGMGTAGDDEGKEKSKEKS